MESVGPIGYQPPQPSFPTEKITPEAGPEEPLTLPEIDLKNPEPQPEQTEDSKTLSKIGEKVIALGEVQDTVEDTQETIEAFHTSESDFQGEASFEGELSDFAEADLLGSMEQFASFATDYVDLIKDILDTKNEIAEQEKQLKETDNEKEKEEIKENISKLKTSLIDMTKKKNEVTNGLSKKMGIDPTSKAIEEKESTASPSKGVEDLLLSSEGAISDLSTLTSKVYAIKQNYKRAKAIIAEKTEVQSQLKEAVTNKNTCLQKILELRVRNLEHQIEENNVSAVRNVVVFTGQTIGTAASINTFTLETALSIGSALGTVGSATGVGALVAGGLSLVIATGYLIYTNRHHIENSMQNMGISAQQFLTSLGTGFDEKTLTHLRNTIETSGLEMKMAASKSVEEEAIDDSIAELEEQIEKLEKDPDNADLLLQVKKMRQEMIERKVEKSVERSVKHALAHRTVTKLSSEHDKLATVGQQLEQLESKRQAINDNYFYGKDIAKLTGAGENKTSVDELKEIHETFQEIGSTELEHVKRYFVQQNKRVKENGEIDPESLDPKNPKSWDTLITGVTAGVK